MFDERDIHLSSRIYLQYLKYDTEGTIDTGMLSMLRAKWDRIGNVVAFSFHHLSTSKLVLDIGTQVVVKNLATSLFWVLGLDSWVDDWAHDKLPFKLAIYVYILFTGDSNSLG